MELTEHRCHRCGGELREQSDTRWKCPYCGSVYDDTTAAKHTADMHEMFDEAKRELINNARRNLYDATVAKYISSEDVKDACREIKRYIPDDFRANFYEIAVGSNLKRLTKAIRSIDVDMYYDDVENIVRFLLKSLQTEYLLELNNLIERAYKERGVLDLYNTLSAAISEEAVKVEEGVYQRNIPRDVFVAYSSLDMEKVSELVETLEAQGLSCFVAARNLRHGKGSVENYTKALEEAMDNCKSFVFVSSMNSRAFGCDALNIEMKYVKENDLNNSPGEMRQNYSTIDHKYKKPRVEYLIEKSRGKNAADKIVREFFAGYEWVLSPDDVAERVMKQLVDAPSSSSERKSEKSKKFCVNCGHENEFSASFCATCGKNEFVSSAEELVKVKNKRELEERKAREEAQKRAEKAESEKRAAQKTVHAKEQNPYSSTADKKVSYTAPSQDKPKKKSHGCLIALLVIIGAIIVFSIAVGIIDELLYQSSYDTPTYSPSPQSFPIVGTYNGLPYELSEDGVLTVSGEGEIYGGSYSDVYLDFYDGSSYRSFYLNDFVQKVVISDGITSIGSDTFRNMYYVNAVELPKSVTVIGEYAFADCISLSQIDLKYVQSIYGYAFTNCSSLKTVSAGSSLSYVNEWAFDYTPYLDALSARSPIYLGNCLYKVHTETQGVFEIPDGITYIAPLAFYNCSQITDINIPSSVTEIGDQAFGYTYNVQNIIYSGDVSAWKSIVKGSSFDHDCGNWTNDGVYSLWCLGGGYDIDSAEPYTEGLVFKPDESGSFILVTGYTGSNTSVIIPSVYLGMPVEGIADYAFESSFLTSISIPSSVKSIGYRAFCDSSLSSVALGEGCELSEVGRDAFTNTPICDGEEPLYLGSSLIYVPHLETDVFSVAQGTKNIADHAFCDNHSIYSVFIPKSVILIGDFAFSNASCIEYILYEGNEDDLASLRVGESCFEGCGSSTYIGRSQFICLNGAYDPNNADTFTNGLKFRIDESLAYVSVIGYSGSDTDVTIPDYYFGIPVEEISDNAFSYSSITSISIPASVKRIGYHAFYSSESLSKLNIADGSALCSVGEDAFSYTPIASEVTANTPLCLGRCLVIVPDDITGSFEIPDGIASVAEYVFSETQITSIVIPESVTYINTCAFYYAGNVSEIIYLGTQEQWEAIVKDDGWDSYCGYYTKEQTYSLHCLNGEYDPSSSDMYSDGLKFTFVPESNAYVITDYTGSDTDVNIPSVYMTSPVIGIASSAFMGDPITSVTIPDSITTIGEFAFYETELTHVTLPASLQELGDSAFAECGSLSSVEFSAEIQLKAIPEHAFNACDIRLLIIPESVEVISAYAFGNNKNLSHVTFSGASKLTTVNDYAFYYDTALEGLILPASASNISSYAFNGCSNIKNITAPTSAISKIPNTSFVTVSINGSGEIPSNALYGCDSLKTLNIGEGITSIGTYAFYNCTSLTDVTLPESLETIGSHAFCNCSILTELSLPQGLKTISSYAFENCSSLSSINIPYSIETIDSYCFRNCTALSGIALPEGLTTLGAYAFNNCSSLAAINIPSTLETINSYTFSGSGLVSITIPDTVSELGQYAFRDCSQLREITVEGVPESMSSDAFYNTRIKKANLSAGAITKIPKTYLVDVTITDGDLPAYAFNNCSALRHVTLHDNIEVIGEYAFSSCTSLLSIELPSSLSGIAATAFSGCTSLAEIINHTIHDASSFAPENVLLVHSGKSAIAYVDDYAFINTGTGSYLLTYMGSNTHLVLPEAYRGTSYTVRKNAFKNRKDITSVTVNGAFMIEDQAFRDCDGITKLILGSSVEYIGREAFYDCDKLSDVTFASSVETIGSYAFYSCDSLTKLSLPESICEIGSHAFYGCSSLASVSMQADVVFDLYYNNSDSPAATCTSDSNSANNAKNLKSTYYNFIWRKQ